jgi:hypothetical protein
LTPTGNGAIQIEVTATSRGHTATATIHQTNFATVREAQVPSFSGTLNWRASVGVVIR